ncbi:MAG: hypothetical protein LiPW15_838 [Parcubacteria group bacterium LiPW_15]|nr:MAG: hypothetical protein LiPW15_838 [Parcubacteria group bacterium LiPW_15]
MEEENIEKRNISGGRLRAIFAYGLIFVLGVLTGNILGAGNRDALKETANLISQTGKEVLAPLASEGVSFSLPLKKSTAPKTKVVVPAVVPSPPKIATFSAAVTSSVAATTSSSAPIAEVASTSPIAATSAQIGAVENPQASPVQEPVVAAAKLLIFEVQITGGPGNSEQDFIKIYNPTPYAVNASGWKLRKRSKTGGESSIKVVPEGTSIASGAVLTWANSKDNFAATMSAEISSTATISADNSIAILDGDGKIIDAVAWGGGSGQFAEGSPYPMSPEAGQILRRKTGGANLQDTDNNAADFEV